MSLSASVCSRLQHQHETIYQPSFNRYVADNDPAFVACCNRSLQDLLTDLLARRSAITNYLMTLTEPAAGRTGHYPEYGRLTVLEWTTFFLLHAYTIRPTRVISCLFH